VPFATLGLPQLILKGVKAAGHIEPTPIQYRAIPVVMQGNDLIGSAQTGTGKTAAYLLPILSRLLEGPRRLRALVLCPTRELAAQVETYARGYARFTSLRIGVVFPGVPIQPQERMLREEGVDLLVATPVRLLDLHGRGAVAFDDIEMLVLDEADRMMDLGFAGDIRRILKVLPETRQTLMFSGTMPPELNRISKEALLEPVRVDLAPQPKPAAGITQAIYPVPLALKDDLLHEMLSRSEVRNVIVFTRTKHGAERLARSLKRRGHCVAGLHDTRSQSQRERALNDLKRGRVQILVATDLASRGIDVDGIAHVVNFDVPHSPEDYVHRIGRGGTSGVVGDAFTLMAPEEQQYVASIEQFLGRTVPRVVLPDFDYRMRPNEIKDVLTYSGDAERSRNNAQNSNRSSHAPARHGSTTASDRHSRTSRNPKPAVRHRSGH
jgi:ATP-dependent RNA helicase RhlE